MSRNNNHVQVMIYEPYPMGLGGNFLTQRLFLERMDRKRFAPIVVAPMEGAALDQFRTLGVECVVLPPPGGLGRYGGAVLRENVFGRLKSAFDLVRYNLQVARWLRERKIDVAYTNCVRAQLSIGLGARLAGVPTLLYIKGELANPMIDRLCFILASKIAFFCARNRDDHYPRFVRWFWHKIGILKIGLDPASITELELFDPSALRRELGIDPTRINVAVLGQLYRPKGQHLAIQALSRLVREFPRLTLYLIGDHVLEEYRAYRDELEALINKYGLGQHVYFTGWRKNALQIISLMDIVIHPSLSEGFGRAVLESMALRKPVVASAVGGLREAIEDGRNGYLVPPGDVEAIAQRWRDLMLDPRLRQRLGNEARRTVFREYLIDDKVAEMCHVWAEMASDSH